jgi:inner membrane protein
MENQGFFEKMNTGIRNSVTVKLLSAAFLMLLLLIPTSMIQDLIYEREYRMKDAILEVSSKWGEKQVIAGPVLTVPYYSYYKDNNDKFVKTVEYAHFLPDNINVEGKLFPEKRYRGIYEVVVYGSKLSIDGKFSFPDFKDWNISEYDIIWKDAFFSFGISDMRGIKDNISLNWNNNALALNPGIESNDVLAKGVSVRVPVGLLDSTHTNYGFSLNISLNGSESLQFIPIGKETKVNLSSAWNTPSFDGAFLPDSRQISDTGFTAQWKVLHLNRSYPQHWRKNTYNIYDSAFGVNLLVPVDEYQKSMRSAKYAVLFIALTFLIFFFVEVINKKRIHPIQYILVGLALCIFYTLLISLSEHITFMYAYIIAAFAVITLITVYCSAMLKSRQLTRLVASVLSVLYIFIYTIIQLQDYALLMGSIGLFAILATVMYLSRNIDWYNLSSSEKK